MGCKHDMHWCVGICDKDNGLCRMCQIDMQAEVERLREWKADVMESTRIVMEEDCSGELHCTCVPLLRAEVERYKRYWTSPQKVFDKNKKLQAEVEAWQEYSTSHGCTCVDSEWYDPEGNAILGGE